MIFAALLFAQVTVPCSNPRIRKDFRVMEKEGKWSRIIEAYRHMKYTGRITYYAKLHRDIFGKIHNNIKFLTWHRAFLWEFENEIRAIGGDDLTLPYIDWAREATTYNGAIDRSVANSQYYYGTQSGQCLVGQIYDSFRLASSLNVGKCIQRQTETSVATPGWADIDRDIINSNTFAQLDDAIQYGIHADVHVRIGGQMAMDISPMDPFFFPHHGFIDLTANIWQFVHNNYEDMGADVSERIVINENEYTHKEVFKMKNICVKYQRYTETKTSHRLKKRQSSTQTSPNSPESTETQALLDTPPDYGNDEIDDQENVDKYNSDLYDYYSGLMKSLNSTDSCYQQIASFYPGSFLPSGDKLSAEALIKIGLDPAKYEELEKMKDIQRDALSKFGNFSRELAKVVDQFTSSEKSGSSKYSSWLVLVTLLLQYTLLN
eukprot:NODE_119_length_18895_cov_0.454990.p5 type:complete len:433 gc:universal NODE_119_length_18895_cov_0.454990:13808-12510(-)